MQAGEQPGNAELPGQAHSCARQLLCIQMPTFGFQWSNQEEVFDAAQLWASVCSKENLESSKLELHAVPNSTQVDLVESALTQACDILKVFVCLSYLPTTIEHQFSDRSIERPTVCSRY